MNEDKLRKQAKSGNNAQAMLSGGKLDSVIYTEAVDLLRAELMTMWKASKSSEDRERIWVSVNLLEKVTDTLGIMASNGRMAQADLERLISSK